MKTLFASLSLCLALLVLASVPGCQVEAQDELPYGCAEDADCGGGGFTCVTIAGRASFCCQKAVETCNGADDDCDGTVDELEGESCYEGPEATRGVGACRDGHPACGEGGSTTCADQVLPAAAETCNRVDDDCDGAVDEGFNLQTDSKNCGLCGRACTAEQVCSLGQCVRRMETSCSDGDDNDDDTLIDCGDDDCRDLSCGDGKACQLDKSCGEALCDNGVNDDGDTGTDCADSDCAGKSCGTGCVCTGGVKKETDCSDNDDNDGLDGADCADPDCGGACGTGCACQGPTKVETACGDGADNDKDGQPDCKDPDCEGKTAGKPGTLCLNGVALEVSCSDGADNDVDGKTDCVSGAADANCLNGVCGAGCKLTNCARQETDCGDGLNNDGDANRDCADTADCNNKSCGTGCVCNTGLARETLCADLEDNDGDNATDCADKVDCPPSTPCRIDAQTVGTCQNSGRCQ